MRTRYFDTLLLLLIIIFLITGCNTSNKVLNPSDTNKPTDVPSSDINSPPQNISVTDSQTIKTASFIDLNHGWIVKGHSILDTEDGGLHWSKIADISVDVHDIDFISLKCGWLATSDGLLNTQDGGITWKEISKPLIKATNQVQFVDEKNGWVIVGNGTSLGPLMGTTDGGNNWTSYEVPGLSLWPSVAFSFISQEQGFIIVGGQPGAGRQGKTLYKTINKGKTWEEIAGSEIDSNEINGLPSGGYLSSLFFLNDKDGWLTESRGQLFVTTNGGKDWTTVDRNPEKQERFMAKPFFMNLYDGYVLRSEAGNTSLMITKDGGVNWKPVYP